MSAQYCEMWMANRAELCAVFIIAGLYELLSGLFLKSILEDFSFFLKTPNVEALLISSIHNYIWKCFPQGLPVSWSELSEIPLKIHRSVEKQESGDLHCGGDGGNTKAGACSSLEIVYTSLIFIFSRLVSVLRCTVCTCREERGWETEVIIFDTSLLLMKPASCVISGVSGYSSYSLVCSLRLQVSVTKEITF